jgi:tight adherence protein B
MGAAPSQGLAGHVAAGQTAYAEVWTRLLWCIRLSETSGAALSTLLERLAEQLESQQDRHRALAAALAGPRMTQKMLAWLPAAGLLLAQLLGANPLGVLTSSTPGRLCLAVGAALWAVNRFWSARLLARAHAPAGTGFRPGGNR